ncbi:iron chaperone [Microbacterium sp. NPDC056234]|uniref:iron chaperone n=1 Tax=Microbacterium sp. NPDC056234 TaxID=3345757 RepID=UPI0035D74F1D
MGTVDDYLDSLIDADRAAVGRVYGIALELVPEAEQGVGYGMPALTYRGRPLVSVKRTKTHFGVYPFSAAVVTSVSAQLESHIGGKGTIRFHLDDPLSEQTIRTIVAARREEIDRLS